MLSVTGQEQRRGFQSWLARWSRRRAEGGSGVYLGASAGPLRVLDAPAALLSMAEEARAGVVFDGLLHNRAELQVRAGVASEPGLSDAEVLLRAYRRLGEGLLQGIRGIFALIIWDDERDLLLCARDPVGVYPLFYSEVGGELLFSTSVDTLVDHPSVPRTFNRAAIANHLRHQWSGVEETLYSHVQRVPPGHVLSLRSGGRQLYRYWDPAPQEGSVDWIREEELERFDQLLDQAVSRYLALGPTAIYLSGGLDSVSVAAAAIGQSRARATGLPLALSLIFPDPECNEEATQRRVATQLGLSQVFVGFDEAVGAQGLLQRDLELSSQLSLPLLNAWLPAYRRLAQEGHQRGARVILTGNGGDEWLGVSPFYAADLLRSLDLVGLYRLLNSSLRSYNTSSRAMIYSSLWRFGARPLLVEAYRAYPKALAYQLFPELMRGLRYRDLLAWQEQTLAWFAPSPEVRRELDRELEVKLPPRVRSFYFHSMRSALDHMLITWDMEETFEFGARNGLRVLHPYWDADLIDLLYRTPPHLLNKGGRSKGLVRASLARRFPGVGFDRQKKVVSSHFYRSTVLRESSAAWRSMGGVSALAELGVVDAATVRESVEHIISQAHLPDAYRIWDVLNLEAWLRPRL